MRHTDRVAEVHNTLRRASPVVLIKCARSEFISVAEGTAKALSSRTGLVVQ
jgi:hypothetical protein